MAKVIAPLHSVQVRGKCGDLIFRRWRGVNTVSGLTGGAGDGTRAGFVAWQAAATSWGLLTTDEMQEWYEYAAKTTLERGPLKPKHRSGYISYSCCAFNAVQCGESAPTSPPATVPPNFPEALTLGVNGSGDLEVGWNSAQDGDYMQIKGSFNAWFSGRTYDYNLGQQGYPAVSAGAWTGPASVATRKNIIIARVLRDSGQAGPWGRVQLNT